jgi:hypothetical protein
MSAFNQLQRLFKHGNAGTFPALWESSTRDCDKPQYTKPESGLIKNIGITRQYENKLHYAQPKSYQHRQRMTRQLEPQKSHRRISKTSINIPIFLLVLVIFLAVEHPARDTTSETYTLYQGSAHHMKRLQCLSSHLDPELLGSWIEIVQDWLLPFYPNITSADIDDTFLQDPGKKVILQHIQGEFYILDPMTLCSKAEYGQGFMINRCFAIYSILNETALWMNGSLPDFEFVYDFEDFPNYRSNNNTMDHKSMPGFGSVRCWQKGFMSFPMFGSHEHWDIKSIDDKIARIFNHSPPPFAERKSAAVFRGGLRGCSFPPENNEMLDWHVEQAWHKDQAEHFYKGAPCGRLKLQVIGEEHPELIDFRNTNDGSGRISMKEQESLFKYIISVEGFGGWADRLSELLFYDVALVVQEHPCKEWYEEMFFPFQHFIPVSNNFDNLLGRIQWAEHHPRAVEDMIQSKIIQAKRVLSRRGIITFSSVLWTLYGDLQRYPISRRNDTVVLKDLFL